MYKIINMYQVTFSTSTNTKVTSSVVFMMWCFEPCFVHWVKQSYNNKISNIFRKQGRKCPKIRSKGGKEKEQVTHCDDGNTLYDTKGGQDNITRKYYKKILQENITRKGYLAYYDTKGGQENITRKGYLIYYDTKVNNLQRYCVKSEQLIEILCKK